MYVLFFWSKWENGVFFGAADAMAAFGLSKYSLVWDVRKGTLQSGIEVTGGSL